jgi:hypothetical protein
MKRLGMIGCTLTFGAASILLAGCGGSEPSVRALGAMTPAAMATRDETVGGVRPAQSCPQRYVECITLAYGSPFEQEWCVPDSQDLGFGSNCVPTSYGTWHWSKKVQGNLHHPSKELVVSVDPNPGNPTDVTISESQRIKPSRGKIVYAVRLEACTQISQGWDCGGGPRFIGISTK